MEAAGTEVSPVADGTTEHIDAFGLDIELGNEPLPGMDDEFGTSAPTGSREEDPGREAAPQAEPEAEPLAEVRSKLSESDARAQQLERQLNQLVGMVQPFVQQMAGARQGAPIPTKEDLLKPEAGVEDLINFLEHNQQRQQAQLLSQMQATALRANSEQRFRGMLSKEALGGDGRDFDSVRQKYLDPIYQQQPMLKHMIDQQFGQDPAIVEYGLAMLLKLNEMHKDDPVKTYRALHDFMEGKGGKDLVDKIDRTARSGADRVATSRGRVDVPSALRSFKPGELARSSDEEFAAIERELGFSGGF